MSKEDKTFSSSGLGDSYTIGESVPLHEGFPYQTIQKLRKAGWSFSPAEVVAKTGWTTFEIIGPSRTDLNNHYNFVTLLIWCKQSTPRPVSESNLKKIL
jgi:hypothetical protein